MSRRNPPDSSRTARDPRACALAFACTLACASPVAGAGFEQCGPGLVLPPAPSLENPSTVPGAVDVEADDADLGDTGVSVLRGNVVVQRGTARVSADEVRYRRDGETVSATGTLRVWDEGVYLTGSRGTMVVPDEVTVVEDAEYRVADAHAHGVSSRIVLSGSDVLKANDATYTTCNPGEPDWVLEAERIRLNKVEDQGTARNVWVRFKGVPIFYTPWLSFPLSDARKSGFLAPSAGVSSAGGVEATVPYYFNILPNLDATVAVRTMTERGVQGQGELRYLLPWAEGRLAGEFMPHDSRRDEARSAVSLRHENDFGRRWNADVVFDWVSDSEYFEELGTSLAVSSQTFLEKRADLTYVSPDLYFRTRLQDYQTVDRSLPAESRPYERLPQFYAATRYEERNLRPNFNAAAELVHFERSSSITGVRWDLRPHVTLPYRTAAGFVVPKATLRYTGYSLDGQPGGTRDDPSRLLPTFSVDSGLFFERRMRFASRAMTQTLEPRAFYLFTPFDRQDDLPVFDTGEYTFSFAQLFREDRFSGADRVSDAHQLALAVTTRFLDPASGAELARASVGQIRYFRDRKVTLPNGERETHRGSALVGEVAANLTNRWRVTAGMQWDPNETRTDRNTLAVRYQPDERRVLNASYRFVRDAIEQTDLSFAWPLARDWRAVGRWNYSLDGDRTVETFAGVEYESCCWGMRLVGRRYLSSLGGEYNTGVFVQLVLKGLAGVGDASTFLDRSIPGYRNEF